MKNKSNFRQPTAAGRPPQAHGSRPVAAGGARPSSRPSHAALGGRSQTPARRGNEPDIPKSWRTIAGHHSIREALRVRPKAARLMWIRQSWESSQDLQELHADVSRLRTKIETKSDAVIDRLCASHQGAVLFVEGGPELSMEKLAEKETSVLVYLDGIEDPHNLGAILRTSWLTGADALFIPEERAVGLTSTAHKVASGGAEHVPVQEVGNFAKHAEELKKMGYWMFGLSHKAEKTLFDVNLPEKIIWAVGNEERGLRVTTERLCDELVSIPQISAAASYNASVATAMALTESLRKHTTHHKNRQKSQ